MSMPPAMQEKYTNLCIARAAVNEMYLRIPYTTRYAISGLDFLFIFFEI